MTLERYAFLYDLHASDSVSDGGQLAAQDGWKVRVFSNWSQRLTEFTMKCVEYDVDRIVLGGDIVHATDAAPTTTLAAILDQIESEVSARYVHAVVGNHECIPDGSLMTLAEFQGTVETALGAGYDPQITVDTKWPGTIVVKNYVSYVVESTNFTIIHLWGAAGGTGNVTVEGNWNTADPANFAYEGGASKIVRPNGDPKNQLDWLADTALAGVAKPVLIFCHEHLADSDGSAAIDSTVVGLVRAILEAVVVAGQPVYCFSGHYHRVKPNAIIDWELDIINGVKYYNFGGSVLAQDKFDMKGNLFFIVDIDTVIGVTAVRTFKYYKDSRGRYISYDISQDRIRSRYT